MAMSLILLICFSSFLGLALPGEQGQFSCQPHGYNTDRGENIYEFFVSSAVPGSVLCFIHFFSPPWKERYIVLPFHYPMEVRMPFERKSGKVFLRPPQKAAGERWTKY
jgi:hypothetical protein